MKGVVIVVTELKTVFRLFIGGLVRDNLISGLTDLDSVYKISHICLKNYRDNRHTRGRATDKSFLP